MLDRPTERWLQEPTGANQHFTIQRGYVVCELPSSVRSYHQGDRLRRRPSTAVVDRIERANPPYLCASSPPFVPQLFDEVSRPPDYPGIQPGRNHYRRRRANLSGRMIVLLTGAPGVGKTTVAQRIASLHPHAVKTIGFGRLVYQAVRSRSPLSDEEFRSLAAEVTTPADLSPAAADMLTSLVASTRAEGGSLLVESHAVARETFGWQAHPDSPSTLAGYTYDTLIHLDAPAHVILSRTRADDGGRLAQDERDVAVLASIQMAVSVYYAAVLGVPLNVIDASRPVDDLVEPVCSLLGLSTEERQ